MNRGAQAARERLQERGQKAQLARELGVGPDMVSRWLSGERLPDPKQRAHLEDQYGIGWRLWDDPEESPDSESKPHGDTKAAG